MIDLTIGLIQGEIERPIETRREMKALMRKKFVRNHYYIYLHEKLQRPKQGSKTVYNLKGRLFGIFLDYPVISKFNMERYLSQDLWLTFKTTLTWTPLLFIMNPNKMTLSKQNVHLFALVNNFIFSEN